MNAARDGAELSADQLYVRYETSAGNVDAIDGVTLRIPSGSSMAIVGASGCGKSTLLGVLGGLELPSSGEAWVADRCMSTMPERDRAQLRRTAFGFVFQSDNLQPFLTVSENVAIQAVLAGVPADPSREAELLEELEVGSLAHRFPDELSGGQRQRVAVARALIHRPRVLLADEPTGSLDSSSSEKVVELLLRMQVQEGSTLVVVTHDRAVAARMEATVHMRDGRLTSAQGGPS